MEKGCDAIWEFEDKKFVMCELEMNHSGSHRGLMFEWEGEGIMKTDDSYWFRGRNLLKMDLQRRIEVMRKNKNG